jgi:glycosyltransferase involved in cell wall biosynthesis
LPCARLELVGVERDVPEHTGVTAHPPADPVALRNFYAAADVLVVPSVPTATFREPWGLVCNEAMHQGLPIIATDAVGAAAGGLVRHERNGLVVAAGDPGALAGALRRLHEEPALRRRMGTHGRRDAAVFTHDAWADGMARALDF